MVSVSVTLSINKNSLMNGACPVCGKSRRNLIIILPLLGSQHGESMAKHILNLQISDMLSPNLLSPESIISGAKNYKIMMYSNLQMLKTGSSNFGQSSGKYSVSPLKAASSLADNTFPEN